MYQQFKSFFKWMLFAHFFLSLHLFPSYLVLFLFFPLSLILFLFLSRSLHQSPTLLAMSLFESLSVSSKCELKNVKCFFGWNQRECCLQPSNSWPKTLFTCYASLFLLNEFILCFFFISLSKMLKIKRQIFTAWEDSRFSRCQVNKANTTERIN